MYSALSIPFQSKDKKKKKRIVIEKESPFLHSVAFCIFPVSCVYTTQATTTSEMWAYAASKGRTAKERKKKNTVTLADIIEKKKRGLNKKKGENKLRKGEIKNANGKRADNAQQYLSHRYPPPPEKKNTKIE